MARTIIGVNDPKAVKRFAGLLAYDASMKSYFDQRFVGAGAEAEVPIQILTDLESDAGEQISFDLLAEMKMAPVEGEDNLEGKEEAQKFFTDTIYIDQARCGINTGGRMTRKRTLHNLREKARRQQSSWWARLRDEVRFIYLSGARGINPNFLLPIGYTGRANNSLTAPDTAHLIYGGNATAKNNMTNEAAGVALIPVQRYGRTNNAVSVHYQTVAGTARPGIDYEHVSGTLSFAPGEMLKTFGVPLRDNVEPQTNRTLQVTLSAPAGGALLDLPPAASARSLVILDDDRPGSLDFGFTPSTLFGETAAYAMKEVLGQK